MVGRAVIVSHGQPGDPGPQQRAIEDLAAAVARADPGCEVRGATLAMPGALAATCGPDSLIFYPMFMAEGWFTRTELPRRLAEAGAGGGRKKNFHFLRFKIMKLCQNLNLLWKRLEID